MEHVHFPRVLSLILHMALGLMFIYCRHKSVVQS